MKESQDSTSAVFAIRFLHSPSTEFGIESFRIPDAIECAKPVGAGTGCSETAREFAARMRDHFVLFGPRERNDHACEPQILKTIGLSLDLH